MKRFNLLITLAFTLLSVLPITAQESVIAEDIYGFESMPAAWWTNAKDVFTISSEKVASGENALKFSCADVTAYEFKNIQMQGGNKKKDIGLVSLAPGDYTVSCKVWLTETTPSAFSINVKKPFLKNTFNLKKVAKGEWVTLSNDFTVVEKATATNLIITVSTNKKWGGNGTFYMDDIHVTKK